MSDDDERTEKSPGITWPLVALVALGCFFVLGIWVFIPKGDAQSRSTLLGIILLIATAVSALFTRSKVNAVDHKVNGRMTQLINEQQDATRQLREAHARLAALTGEVPTEAKQAAVRKVAPSKATSAKAAQAITTEGRRTAKRQGR